MKDTKDPKEIKDERSLLDLLREEKLLVLERNTDLHALQLTTKINKQGQIARYQKRFNDDEAALKTIRAEIMSKLTS